MDWPERRREFHVFRQVEIEKAHNAHSPKKLEHMLWKTMTRRVSGSHAVSIHVHIPCARLELRLCLKFILAGV